MSNRDNVYLELRKARQQLVINLGRLEEEHFKDQVIYSRAQDDLCHAIQTIGKVLYKLDGEG